ncbi:NRAMP family divalent metal transporter [Mannheimia varigena]|uniref:NRAMP family divalent metal transporter n=1 Tax=Mannheimia varigena TaxID=85404 RepID=UPI0015B6289A|nr:NRAMP family divalent metal transporter [Mannheimia varigena]MDY2946809.1 NRAMP family divalent metal transporter [Mannheimia varigena]QLD33496.1 divalent metal cation transporter [Mannheimia varigena]
MTQQVERSTWQSKFAAMGPGILMASAAVGGSHIVASTQAGAIYGWQLAIIIILANLFKYPFFRFGVQYTLSSGKSLLEGYKDKGGIYLFIFFILNVLAGMINTAAVGIVTAAILKFIFSALGVSFDLSIPMAGTIVIVVTWGILLLGKYRFLDSLSKWIMIALTISTVTAVVIAALKGGITVAPDFIEPSPWNLAALGFIVALMGWMPAPIEISAINSMWVIAKKRFSKISYQDGIFDFNVGYIGTAILAIVFLALGALVQYGSGEQVEQAGVKYIAQLIKMYAFAIGDWSKLLIAFIAFMCMFGTTITVIDGYSRANAEALRILTGRKAHSQTELAIWLTLTSAIGILIISVFMSDVAAMLKFAMISSFVSTPIFAWLNFSLVLKGEQRVTGGLFWLAVVGLIYLTAFALLFLAQQFGIIG